MARRLVVLLRSRCKHCSYRQSNAILLRPLDRAEPDVWLQGRTSAYKEETAKVDAQAILTHNT